MAPPTAWATNLFHMSSATAFPSCLLTHIVAMMMVEKCKSHVTRAQKPPMADDRTKDEIPNPNTPQFLRPLPPSSARGQLYRRPCCCSHTPSTRLPPSPGTCCYLPSGLQRAAWLTPSYHSGLCSSVTSWRGLSGLLHLTWHPLPDPEHLSNLLFPVCFCSMKIRILLYSPLYPQCLTWCLAHRGIL